MKILVTGANGFIGKVVCRRLAESGRKVRGIVYPENVPQFEALKMIETRYIGDIGEKPDWTRVLDGMEVVVHLAGRVHVLRETAQDPQSEYDRINTEATKHIAETASDLGVKRFVFISTVKVNGESTPPDRPFTERDTPQPRDLYGLSKFNAESVLRLMAADRRLESVIIRLPLVYGPGVGGNFLRLLKLVEMGVPLPFGMLRNKRSLIFVENVADAIATCVTHEKAANETFLVSDAPPVSTPDLLRLIAGVMGKKVVLLPVPESLLRLLGVLSGKKGEVERLIGSLCIDQTKAENLLSWRPPFSIETGIKSTVSWYGSL